LCATLSGTLAGSASARGERERVEFGLNVLAATFPAIRAHVEHVATTDWSRERGAYGAFAVFYPGQMTTLAHDVARPEARLHFAGEHTSIWSGWMEGALESAERVVDEVLKA
jgi:monoamine oxidase